MRFVRIITLLFLAGLVISCTATQNKTPEVLSTITVDGKTPRHKSNENRPFFILLTPTDDKGYGRTPEKPINVGVGASEQHKYLNSLAGPNGELLEYTRLGACCPFEDPALPFGGGLLDIYQVIYEGASEPVNLYLNLYHEDDKLYIPVGFTSRNN